MKWIHPIGLRYSKAKKAEWTKCLPRIGLNFLSFKTVFKPWERNGMQKKRMRNKRMQIKLTFDVKITLNVDC